MKKITIIIGSDCPQVRELANFLISEGMDVVSIHSEANAVGLPSPQESPLILLAIPDEHIEEGYSQLLEWKKIYPTGGTMLLPMGSSENWKFAVTQMKMVADMGQTGCEVALPQEKQAAQDSHAEQVDALMHQLAEKLGPAAADYFEKVDGIGYHFKHNGPIVGIDMELLRMLGYGLDEHSD